MLKFTILNFAILFFINLFAQEKSQVVEIKNGASAHQINLVSKIPIYSTRHGVTQSKTCHETYNETDMACLANCNTDAMVCSNSCQRTSIRYYECNEYGYIKDLQGYEDYHLKFILSVDQKLIDLNLKAKVELSLDQKKLKLKVIESDKILKFSIRKINEESYVLESTSEEELSSYIPLLYKSEAEVINNELYLRIPKKIDELFSVTLTLRSPTREFAMDGRWYHLYGSFNDQVFYKFNSEFMRMVPYDAEKTCKDGKCADVKVVLTLAPKKSAIFDEGAISTFMDKTTVFKQEVIIPLIQK